MSKVTVAILYVAVVLTLFAPTVELVRNTIIPGIEQLHTTLQEVAR